MEKFPVSIAMNASIILLTRYVGLMIKIPYYYHLKCCLNGLIDHFWTILKTGHWMQKMKKDLANKVLSREVDQILEGNYISLLTYSITARNLEKSTYYNGEHSSCQFLSGV